MQTVTESFMVALVGHSEEFRYNAVGLEDFTLERFNYTQLLKGSFYRSYKPAAMAIPYGRVKKLTSTIFGFTYVHSQKSRQKMPRSSAETFPISFV